LSNIADTSRSPPLYGMTGNISPVHVFVLLGKGWYPGLHVQL